jgi:hypothetical protein
MTESEGGDAERTMRQKRFELGQGATRPGKPTASDSHPDRLLADCGLPATGARFALVAAL